MSHLLQSWAESLKIFYPKNLLNFLLGSWSLAGQGIKVLFQNFWWLIFINIILMNIRLDRGLLFDGVAMLYIITSAFLIFFIYLAIMPSEEKKNFKYFFNYFKYLLNWLLVSLIGFLFFSFLIQMEPLRVDSNHYGGVSKCFGIICPFV